MEHPKRYPDFPRPIKLENPDPDDGNHEDKLKAAFFSQMQILPFSAFNGIHQHHMESKHEIGLGCLENPHCKRKSNPLEKCPICKRYFRRIQTHLQKHTDHDIQLTSLTCKYCFKHFSNLGNLQIHLRTHTNTKPYVCDVCSKAFTQSCNLTNHKRTHTGERPFKCPHCERSFSQSGNLSNHIRLHLDLKPFKCHFCDKCFTQSGNLTSHLKNNHHERD